MTKQFGNNPKIKILLLHGGPAMTHEYMECFETFFQKQGFEFYEYYQLGSAYSAQPKDSSLWTTERFVEEVEQNEVAFLHQKIATITTDELRERFSPALMMQFIPTFGKTTISHSIIWQLISKKYKTFMPKPLKMTKQ